MLKLRARLGQAQPWELSERDSLDQDGVESMARGVALQATHLPADVEQQATAATLSTLDRQARDLAASLQAEVAQAFTNLGTGLSNIITEKHHRSLEKLAAQAQDDLDFQRALALSVQRSKDLHRVLYLAGSTWCVGSDLHEDLVSDTEGRW